MRATGEFFFPKAALTAKRTVHDFKRPAGRSQSASNRGGGVPGATDFGGHLPRLRNVPHDGRGAAVLSRGRRGFGEQFLEVPLPSPKSRGMDWLLASRPDSAVVFLPGRRGAAVFHRKPRRARAIQSQDDVARLVAGGDSGVARSFSSLDRQATNLLDF